MSIWLASMTDRANPGTGHTCTQTCAPDAAGAALCPKSPTYWRLPQNRADGQLYRETTLAEVYASVGEE